MPDKKLEPLLFRLSREESVQAIAKYLGDRLPPEYRVNGVFVRIKATPDGLDAVFAAEPKKTSWKFWRTD